MPTTIRIAETDEGLLELIGNELVLTDKTTGDPCAIGAISRNGGICKWNLRARRPDGSVVEIGYLYGKQDERYPGQQVGELEIWVKGPTQGAADTKVIGFRHDGPIVYTGGGLTAAPSRFLSDDGRYVYNVQGDPTQEFPHGRIVQYEAATMTPVAILRPEPL